MEQFLEKRGALLVSLFFHLALFSFFIARTIEHAAVSKPLPRIRMELRRPPPPTPTPQPARSAAPKEAAAMSAAPTEEIDTSTPLSPKASEAIAQVVDPEEEEKEEREESPSSSDFEKEIQKALETQKDRLQKRQLAQEAAHKKLKNELQREELRAKGRKAFTTTLGAPTGAVRTLELEGYPKQIIDAVKGRYGIQIVRRFIREGESFTYLNRASTNKGTYYSTPGSGYYEVFQLSPRAVAKMVELETDAIRRRGLNPKNTRVVEVVFGIVETDDGHDLGVLRLVAEEIP